MSKATASSSGAGVFAAFEWTVAMRYLRGSLIALFSVLGIAIGVAALIVVMAVMNGFHRELLNKILGVNGHAFVQAAEPPFTNWQEAAKEIAAIPGVTLAAPMVENAAGISSQLAQTGVLARGVRGEDLKRLPGVAGNVREGTLDGFDSAGGLAIGQRLAEQLGVRVGDTVSLIIAKGAQTPFGVMPRIKAYPVVAIFSIGMSEFDNLFAYMPLSEAQAFFNRENEVTVIEVFVDDPEKIDDFTTAIGRVTQRPLMVIDWRERNKTFFDTVQVEKHVLFIILALIVIVAAFNIISGLIMLVKDRTKDIGILRTMGATRGAILRIFLIIGALIGVIGDIFGFTLGLLLATNLEGIRMVLNRLTHANLFPAEIYFLSHLPSSVEPGSVALVVGMAFTLAILASIYPAWKAASLDPVEALRSE